MSMVHAVAYDWNGHSEGARGVDDGDDGFEVYTGQITQRTSEPSVGIQKSGVLVLNPEAWAAIGEPTHVELLFNRQTRTMGIRSAPPNVQHAVRVRTVKSSPSRMISGRGFLSHFGVAFEQAQRYPAEVRDGMLVIDVNADAADPSSPRATGAR